jgi:hypothetical protein
MLIYLALLFAVIGISLLLYGQTKGSLLHIYVGILVGIIAVLLVITSCFIP